MFQKKFIAEALLLVIVLGFSFRASAEASGDADRAAKSYEHAYNLILDEKWDQAIQAFEKHLKEFPTGNTAEGARFWLCLAREKSGRLEEAARCYQNFIQSYPRGERSDQARQKILFHITFSIC